MTLRRILGFSSGVHSEVNDRAVRDHRITAELIYSTIEGNVGIMCACMPFFPALVKNSPTIKQLLISIRSWVTRTKSAYSTSSTTQSIGRGRFKAPGTEGGCLELGGAKVLAQSSRVQGPNTFRMEFEEFKSWQELILDVRLGHTNVHYDSLCSIPMIIYFNSSAPMVQQSWEEATFTGSIRMSRFAAVKSIHISHSGYVSLRIIDKRFIQGRLILWQRLLCASTTPELTPFSPSKTHSIQPAYLDEKRESITNPILHFRKYLNVLITIIKLFVACDSDMDNSGKVSLQTYRWESCREVSAEAYPEAALEIR